jgi:cytochrome c oxidase subunit IV
MSETETMETDPAAAPTAHEETVSGEGHAHPSDKKYVVIALILGVITAVEILFFYIEDDLGNTVVITGLLLMMVVKFWIVAAFFMHLRFDSSLFTRLFYSGLALAVAVYIGALTTFQFWGGEGDVVDETEVDGTGEQLPEPGPRAGTGGGAGEGGGAGQGGGD